MGRIEISNIEVYGLKASIRGMRNPKMSHILSDSYMDENANNIEKLIIGSKDLTLAQTLIKGGGEHRKFMRMIQVWMDIRLPRYMWQEYDTYKFNTKNSESTMHTIAKKPITLDDFYIDNNDDHDDIDWLLERIDELNELRDLRLQTNEFKYVIKMKKRLPESFLQLRTVNTNYEEVRNMYFQREHHRLVNEWSTFTNMVKSLPYAHELILYK